MLYQGHSLLYYPLVSKCLKFLIQKKKTIGIRVPNHPVAQALVQRLGNPILSTSLHDTNEVIYYMTDAELIEEKFRKKVDMVIDCGPCGNVPSTVIDCTGNEPIIVREGLGKLEDLFTR